MDAGQPLAQVRGDRPLVGRGRGRRRAGRRRPPRRRLAPDARRQPLGLPRRERLDDAVRRRSARRPRSAARGRPAAPASACRAGTGRAGSGGRSRAGRRSRGSRPGRCGRRVPRAARWSRPSSRGRRSRPRRPRRRPAPAPPRPRAITPSDWSSGVVGTFARVDAAAVEQDGVGEGPADVDAEQHPAQCHSSRRLLPSEARTMWMPSSSGSVSGKSTRRWPPRDSARARAQVATAFASG